MMTLFRTLFPILAILALSACATGEPASRSSSVGQIDVAQTAGPVVNFVATDADVVVMASKYTVADLRVNVPRSLKVSEANSFLPKADIVWRGEPRGDRHAQVTRIFNDGLGAGTRGMARGPAAIIEVEVTRFHCLTEKTRFTVGGTHAIQFILTVRDAATGAVLEGPRPIVADVKASGGAAAIAEDLAGRTQRVVVVERIAQVIRRELSAPVAAPEAQAALAGRAAPAVPATATGL